MKFNRLLIFAAILLFPLSLFAEGSNDLTEEFFQIALGSFKAKDYPTALRQFEAILKVNPGHKPSLEYLDKTRNITDSLKYRKMNAGRVEKMWKNAVSLYNSQQYSRAKQLFSDILLLDPDHKGAKDYLAKFDNSLGVVASVHVSELYTQALELYADGNYLEAKKYFETTTLAALKYFEAVVLDRPQRLDTLEFIADCDQKMKEQQEKVENLEKEKIENRVFSIYQRAQKFFDRGYYKAAMSELSDCKKIADEFKVYKSSRQIDELMAETKKELVSYYMERAGKELEEKKYDEAFTDYSSALSITPENKKAAEGVKISGEMSAKKYYEQGMKFFSQNQFEGAKDNFEKSLTFQPGMKEALRALERIKK